MKYKIISIIFLSIFCTTLSFAGPFCAKEGIAKEGRHGRYGRRGKIMKEVMREIGLTEEQEKTMKILREQGKGKRKKLRKDMRAKKIAIKMELNKKDSDKAELNRLADELAQTHKKLIDHRINRVLEMKKVLSPEQFELLTRKMEIKREVRKELRKAKGKKHREEKYLAKK